jgi:hypothetical protein
MSAKSSIYNLRDVHPEYWGPAIINEGRSFVFQGEKFPIPKGMDGGALLAVLMKVENYIWTSALPAEEVTLRNKKLRVITKDVPPDWVMIACMVISLLILGKAAFSAVRSRISKL